jgi:hypothetical protein
MYSDAVFKAVFAHAGPWTEDDYFALPDVPAPVELVDGALLVTPLSSIAHQRLIYETTHVLRETCTDDRWEALPGANVKGIDQLTASAYQQVDGSYREFANAPDGVLRLDRPWPVQPDLRAMARGRR